MMIIKFQYLIIMLMNQVNGTVGKTGKFALNMECILQYTKGHASVLAHKRAIFPPKKYAICSRNQLTSFYFAGALAANDLLLTLNSLRERPSLILTL